MDEACTAIDWWCQSCPEATEIQAQPHKSKHNTADVKVDASQGNPIQRKLRVLALHGYGQTPQGFRHKTGSLRSDRTVKKVVDFHYAQAPMQIDDCDHSISNKLGGTFGYWQPRGSDPNTECLAAVTWANDLCKQEGPFDGVFAFSQGAALAALLISLQTTQPQAAPHIRFRFACFFSGFIPTVIGGGVRVGLVQRSQSHQKASSCHGFQT